tara:strand:- start:79 stop:432 length:354 start_codon:yes stop_codon:yes gene_type:complete
MSKTEKQIIVIENKTNYGITGLLIGFVGIFFFSIILSPIALILGLIGIFRGQIISGLFAIIFAVMGLLTSVIFMGFLGLAVLDVYGIFFILDSLNELIETEQQEAGQENILINIFKN